MLDPSPAALAVRMLAYGLVILVTAAAGLRWGLVCAVVVSAAFTAIEAVSGFHSAFAPPLNAAFSLVGTGALAYVVDLLRRQHSTLESARVDLQGAQHQIEAERRLGEARTALRLAQQRFAAVGESLPFGTWETDAQGHLVHVSENYSALFRMSTEEIGRGGWRERVDPQDAERFLAAWHARTPSQVFESEYRVHSVDGKTYWILSRGGALTDSSGAVDGWGGFSRDITTQKESEERLMLLSDLGRVLSLSLDPAATLDRAAQVLVPTLGDWCAVDLVEDGVSLRRALVLDWEGLFNTAGLLLSADDQGPLPFRRTATRVVATKTSQLRNFQPAAVTRSDGQHSDGEFVPTSLMALPLIARDKTLGALLIATCRPLRNYSQEDLDFGLIVARRVALALDNALLYDRERRVADMFQRASLPTFLPSIPGIAIHAHYQPAASEAEIGGDWYDAFQLSDGRIGISIGDVAGKGLQAASIMSTIRLFLRATALEGLSPDQVLERANNLLLNDRSTMVTAIFGILDPEEMTFTCCIAGHPPPIVVGPHGDLCVGIPSSAPLGIVPEATFPQQTLMLPLGSLLVLYTDGLVENRKARESGHDDLLATVRSIKVAENANPAEGISEQMADAPPRDDVAVLTVSVDAKPLLELDLTLPARPATGRIFRQALRRLYLAAGFSEKTIGLLQVAMGEAITNSIQHAYGIQGGTVRVLARVESGRLIVDVCDSGRWRTSGDYGGGYGLQIIRSIIPDVNIRTDESGTVVRLTQPIGRSIT